MTDGLKGKLLNSGHVISVLTGIDFDGIITCKNTPERENKFVFRRAGNKIEPSFCRCCQEPLQPSSEIFRVDIGGLPEDMCAG